MDSRRFWPFPIPFSEQESEETGRQVAFLERANQEGHKGYSDQGGVLGAEATNGREGEMIPRSGIDRGLRRCWEVLLIESSHRYDSFFVDGFENAAEAVLQWLRGEDSSLIRLCIHEYIVEKP